MKSNVVERVILIGLAVASPSLPLSFYFWGDWNSSFRGDSLGMALGIISYTYFLTALIISTRIRYLDRVFGHDRVMVFHGYLAAAAFGCALGHYLSKQYDSFKPSAQTALGMAALTLFTVVIVTTVLFMITGLPHRLRSIARLKSFVIKTGKADYSLLKRFHNLTSLAALIITVHVLLASATQENLARMVFMAAWAALGLARYGYHKIVRVAVARRRALTITGIAPLAPGIVEIRMAGTVRTHRSGQFAYFRILSPVCGHAEHPFTISSAPGSGILSITVKNLGDYTSRLKDVAVGTTALVDGPYGVFSPRQDGHPHLFVAGGIGITPFLSILSDWEGTGIHHPVTLIWSTRIRREMTCRDHFSELQQKNPIFTFVPVLSREGGSGQRIDEGLLGSVVKASMRKEIAVYLCGPESLRLAVFGYLKTLGVPARNLHHERFSF